MKQTSRQLSHSLRDAGIRVTPQRLAVFQALQDSREHLSAEALHQRVRQRQPGLSLATVYRTLEMLRDVGLVLEGRLGDERNFYETNVEPHFHLVCLRCHSIEDLAPEKARRLQHEVAEQSGHEVRWSRLEFFGICANCQANPPGPPSDPEAHAS